MAAPRLGGVGEQAPVVFGEALAVSGLGVQGVASAGVPDCSAPDFV